MKQGLDAPVGPPGGRVQQELRGVGGCFRRALEGREVVRAARVQMKSQVWVQCVGIRWLSLGEMRSRSGGGVF